ncbi:MAG TPA: glycosyltransferase family 39 protein [Pedobacter sp.]|uniref:ArnT family glycosyltransferase n=1 Tax=Pedobacter sp. TaxID=1411316 RepID=UPI002C8037A2|nr:glycosyltransferase family 39 protein [Pedobacter sp.]HMI01240.1 glycosyltransferase family 39 protein [Pedobacter sp.]
MPVNRKSSDNILFIFLGIWVLLNLIQAAFVEVHADEAYYWMYSRFLDWGYFDHPPMVALFIKTGDAISGSTLGLRLITVLTSTLSVYFLWQMLKPYAVNIKLFILLFGSVVLFHVYGFITTPDAPLAFFTVLFFYVYQRYEKEDNRKWALLLALVIACLLYSKYHAILVLFFTVISNLKLLQRRSFWGIVLVSILVFLPHIWWQVQNNYPSFYYHVIDRSAAFYKFRYTTEYLLAQLALAGPLVGWYLYSSAAVLKTSDSFIRALKFNCYGIFIFFLFSTLKGRVEAHWTLPAMLCLFILAYIALADRPVARWFERLAIANIALVILVRLVLIVPLDALKKVRIVAYYFSNEEWAKQIRQKAGNYPVIFYDSFQAPSRYNYYTRSTKGFSYDSRNYRKNQYDIWPLEDSIRHKKAYLVLDNEYSEYKLQDTIRTEKGIYYGTWIDSVRMYQKVSVNPLTVPAGWKTGALRTLKLKITNPYDEPLVLGNKNQKWKCYLEYSFKKGDVLEDFKPVQANLEQLNIPAGASAEITGTIKAPATAGKYKLILSLRTEPFRGGRNSNIIAVEIK